MGQLISGQWLKKYRYVLVVLAAGIIFMLLPESAQDTAEKTVVAENMQEDMEERLQQILCRIDGAGEVAVMLTEAAGERIIYQRDGEDADTVVITDENRNETGLIHTREPPQYRGVIIVCTGADRASVRLAIVEAVSNVTGLGTDKITVLKMK